MLPTQALSACRDIQNKTMARARMISQSISNSRKVAMVSDQAALLFTWIQPHTDDFGRIEGGADDVLYAIVPRRNWTAEQVEGYLKELWEAGLLKAYRDEIGKRYFEVIGFEEHQTFRSDRSRKAKCPIPTEFGSHWYTTGNQWEKPVGEVKLREVKLTKAKVKQKAPVGKPTGTAQDIEPTKSDIQTPTTPKDRAKMFFEGVEQLRNKQEVPWLKELLNAIASSNSSMQKAVIWAEIKSFSDYWTELTHTGLKQRWECQKTFEVEKRLRTWFNRAGFKSFTTGGAQAKSGKGKVIIGLDEDANE